MPAERVTPRQFWQRFEQLERIADVRAARFADDTPERQRRRKAEAIVLPERFNAHYLPHYFRSGPADFHLSLYRVLETDRRIAVRAPRGHAKTTVVTFAYTLHQVVCARELRAWEAGTLEANDPLLFAELRAVMRAELDRRVAEAELALGRTPTDRSARWALDQARAAQATGVIPLHWDPYIQLIAVTEDLAVEFTSALQLELLENELLRSDWGEGFKDPRQSAGDWVSASDVRVKAFGMTGSIRGGKHGPWRPTLAIFDDPDSERTIGTLTVRDSQATKVTAAVTFGLEPKKSRVFMVGTPLHPDCLVCRFTSPEKFQGWTKLRFAAIRENGEPLWPERWPLEALREAEAEDPDSFAMEMMDVPPSTGKPFTQLHYYDRAEFENVPLGKILVFDPAMGKNAKSDLQALVVLRGPTREGDVLVHRTEGLRIGDPRALVAHLNVVRAEEQPDVAVIETIGFQALLMVLLADDADDRGLVGDWEQIEAQTENKDLRIRGMAPSVNQGRIKWPRDRSCRVGEVQALDYPDGKRDILDGIEMGFRRLRRPRLGAKAARHRPRRAAGFGPGGW